MKTFDVTYEIVTPESAEHGDYDETGYIAENVSLRDAIEYLFQTRTSHCDCITGIEANNYPASPHYIAWIKVYNGSEFLTGASESRAIHFPDGLTPATKARIMRLIGVEPCRAYTEATS